MLTPGTTPLTPPTGDPPRGRALWSWPNAISRIRRTLALEPHLAKTFKLSKDPTFIEKVRNEVGLYFKLPDKALVQCVVGRSGIQAPDRTTPLLTMWPGQAERRAHE